MLQLVRLLSQHYQGLLPFDVPPNYNPVPVVPHDPDMYPSITTVDLDHTYRFGEVAPHNQPDRIVPARVDFRLAATQIKAIHATVQAELRENVSDPTVFISRQDALSALLLYCISHTEPDVPPIQRLATIVMVRTYLFTVQ